MSGHGILSGASAFNNQRMGGVRRGISPPPSSTLKTTHIDVPHPLDDPVLDGVKSELTIGNRIGFEPTSQRFARIAFFINNRMDMKLTDWQQDFEPPSCQLLVTRKNGENECPFPIAIQDMENALHLLFARVRHWRSVDFSFDVQNRIVDYLLDAILAESPRSEIDIRRLSVASINYDRRREKFVDILHRGAPNLRSLAMPLSAAGEHVPAMVQAIGACHQLRRLVIDTSFSIAADYPPSFLGALLGLKKLNGLLLGHGFLYERLTIAHHSLSIDDDWLPFVARPAFHPLLNRIQRLTVILASGSASVPAAHFQPIVTEMRSPARVVIESMEQAAQTWTAVWDDYLPLVYRTRATILTTLSDGLPVGTAEEFEEGRATLPAIVQASLIPPDLQNAAVQDQRYLTLEFHFANDGGQLTVNGRDQSLLN